MVASSTLFVSSALRAEDNSRKREAAFANVPRGGAASGLLPPMRIRWRRVSLVSVAGGIAVGEDLSDVMVYVLKINVLMWDVVVKSEKVKLRTHLEDFCCLILFAIYHLLLSELLEIVNIR